MDAILIEFMKMRPAFSSFLIALAASGLHGQSAPTQNVTEFMGRKVTITEPERDADGFSPTGPASICLEGPPERQCYTFPKEFGNSPAATAVELKKGESALLFSAASGGISGWAIRFALLQPGTGKDLENLFEGNVTLDNQSEHAFWTDPSVSTALVFVTADYVWGPGESHYRATGSSSLPTFLKRPCGRSPISRGTLSKIAT